MSVHPPADAFFAATSSPGRYAASAATVGPWDPGAQHGGPPAALLARELQRVGGHSPDWRFARISVDLLGPVPVGELSVSAARIRDGRRVALFEADLSTGTRVAARARGWQIRVSGVSHGAVGERPPLPFPDMASQPPSWPGGYLQSFEWRFVTGEFGRTGPSSVWARPLVTLVAGEPMSGLQRAMLLADIGNGLSNELDIATHLFINPELTVHLHREPAGDWLGVDARSSLAGDGVGLAETVLFDASGSVGRGAQALLVAER